MGGDGWKWVEMGGEERKCTKGKLYFFWFAAQLKRI